MNRTLFLFYIIFLIPLLLVAQRNEKILTMQKEIDSLKQIVYQLTKDTDQDGVPDFYDKENNTPTNARIDGSGVALDTDLDAIIDKDDKCVVDPGVTQMQGCPICGLEAPSQYLELTKDIFSRPQFEYLDSTLTDEDKKKLDHSMNELKYFNENILLFIEASANDYSSFKKNYVLSKIRAQNAYDYLVSQYPNYKDKLIISAKGNKAFEFAECENRKQCDNPEDAWKNKANNNIMIVLRMKDLN